MALFVELRVGVTAVPSKNLEAFNISNEINFRDISESRYYLFDFEITRQLNLTPAELKLFKLIYSGLYKNKEIAYYSHLSERTVEGLMTRLKSKLGCQYKEQLFEKVKMMHAIIRSHLMDESTMRTIVE